MHRDFSFFVPGILSLSEAHHCSKVPNGLQQGYLTPAEFEASLPQQPHALAAIVP